MAQVCETSSSSSADGWSEMDIASKICSLTYRPPAVGDKIFKDECMYCFKSPLHSGRCLFEFSGWIRRVMDFF